MRVLCLHTGRFCPERQCDCATYDEEDEVQENPDDDDISHPEDK